LSFDGGRGSAKVRDFFGTQVTEVVDWQGIVKTVSAQLERFVSAYLAIGSCQLSAARELQHPLTTHPLTAFHGIAKRGQNRAKNPAAAGRLREGAGRRQLNGS
jgi:hypothetical protein